MRPFPIKAKLLPILNRCDQINGETVRKEIASRRAVLPLNFLHPEARPMVIGKQFKTKINANIGTSDAVRADAKKEEIVKLTEAVNNGADTVMDLSVGEQSRVENIISFQVPFPLAQFRCTKCWSVHEMFLKSLGTYLLTSCNNKLSKESIT